MKKTNDQEIAMTKVKVGRKNITFTNGLYDLSAIKDALAVYRPIAIKALKHISYDVDGALNEYGFKEFISDGARVGVCNWLINHVRCLYRAIELNAELNDVDILKSTQMEYLMCLDRLCEKREKYRHAFEKACRLPRNISGRYDNVLKLKGKPINCIKLDLTKEMRKKLKDLEKSELFLGTMLVAGLHPRKKGSEK